MNNQDNKTKDAFYFNVAGVDLNEKTKDLEFPEPTQEDIKPKPKDNSKGIIIFISGLIFIIVTLYFIYTKNNTLSFIFKVPAFYIGLALVLIGFKVWRKK